MQYSDGPRPRLFAHRGCSADFPENTLEAFRAGIDAGADRLELDVHASSDGGIVVFHDATLERTTDGSGLIRNHTMAELEQLDAGYHFHDSDGSPHRGNGIRIPKLVDLLEQLPGVPLNIEIKQSSPGIEDEVMRILEHYGALDHTLLAAAEDSLMQRIRAKVSANVITGFAGGEAAEFVMRCSGADFDGYTPPGFALQVPPEYMGVKVVTPETVDHAHRLGIEVHVWTINVPGEIETLIEMGVDGIMSDDVRMAASVVDRYRR